MSEFWKRKMRTFMHLYDYDKDGYISEKDFADMGRSLADAYNATPEQKDSLTIAFVNASTCRYSLIKDNSPTSIAQQGR